MNKTRKLVGTGIAVIVGSVLAVAPAAGASVKDNPARICVDNSSAGQCESVVPQAAPSGGGGQEVMLQPTAVVERIDPKDHPNFGHNTPAVVERIDPKDHPNFGQSTAQGGGGGAVVILNLRVLRAS